MKFSSGEFEKKRPDFYLHPQFLPKSAHSMANEHLISGIHNYCDRWCERCLFLDRCSLGVIERKRWAKGKDWRPEDFMRELDALFDEPAGEASWMEEMDFSMEEQAEEEVPDAQTEARQKDLRERGMHYFRAVRAFLDSQQARLEERRVDLAGMRPEGPDQQDRSALAEALEVISWYLHFMFVKANRAVSGLDDMHEDHWDGAQQSDANGSAKLAILAAQRSIGAWRMVHRHWPDQGEMIAGFIRQLDQFRRIMERDFPDWQQFIRPGFDTEPAPATRFGEN